MLSLELLPERNCATCTATQKDTFGCTSKAKQTLELDGQQLDRCPRRPFLEDPEYLSELFWYYQQMQNGFLPNNGGLQDQPHRLMTLIRIIGTAVRDGSKAKEDIDRKRKNRLERVRQKK